MSHHADGGTRFLAWSARPWFVIAFVWSVATGINLEKAVHLDDTSYLETAHAILRAPAHPLSQDLNWADRREPIHRLNQPALWSGIMAAVMLAFGDSEVVLHLTLSLFLAAALVLFHDLAYVFAGKHASSFTALFGLGPAILPSQNLMTDIPMSTLWLAFFVCLVRAERPRRRATLLYLLAATAATAACLTKYTSLALLPILVSALLLRGRRRLLWVALVPVAGLVAWSMFNHADYGGLHLLARPQGIEPKGLGHGVGSIVVRCFLWLVALGAVSPFAAIAVATGLREAKVRRFLAGLALVAVAVFALGQGVASERAMQSGLRALFLFAGVVLVHRIATCFRGLSTRLSREERDSLVLLGLWLASAAAFIVLFSPFIAVRHIVPALPPVLLLLSWQTRTWQRAPALKGSLAATAILGVLLAVSDWCYADAFRAMARRVAERHGSRTRIWSVGHWGWQWYAGKAGFLEYDRGRSTVRPGDVVVWPTFIHAQHLDPADAARLSAREVWEVPASPATWFRTVGAGAGFYYFWWDVPWTLTRRPLAEFRILEVTERATPLAQGAPDVP